MPMNFILIARGDSGDPDNAHYFPNAQPANNNNAQRPTPAQLVQRNLIYVVDGPFSPRLAPQVVWMST